MGKRTQPTGYKPVPQDRRPTVADVEAAMESIAPTGLAQQWDHVGLVAGDMSAKVRRILLCIDLTPPVVDEAVLEKADLILAYHPPLFDPITSLKVPSTGTDEAVFRCIRRGIAIYTTHTALDAAEGGTNDVIASLIGLTNTEPLEYVDRPGDLELKVVVFVPPEKLNSVAEAMFAAGAGRIGDYSRCSYRTSGRGTFFGGESTDPAIGKRGQLEFVDEVRLETVVSTKKLAAVVSALVRAHPYEEPAFDVYPLTPPPVRGIGRLGRLPRSIGLAALARKLKKAIAEPWAVGRAVPDVVLPPCRAEPDLPPVLVVGNPDCVIERAIIVVGAPGSLPFRLPLSAGDVVVTGEIRHHDALTILRRGCSAIALGHWSSERPVLGPLAQRLKEALPGLACMVSNADRDPFRSV